MFTVGQKFYSITLNDRVIEVGKDGVKSITYEEVPGQMAMQPWALVETSTDKIHINLAEAICIEEFRGWEKEEHEDVLF